MEQRRLFRLLWLSIAAAVATITLKVIAWALTGSVGLLSDAAESVVNLVAAAVALAALRWAVKPADEEHAYGHAKADPAEGEDVLEETPDFLQETPEHERLWFEQKPPRDFDWDK